MENELVEKLALIYVQAHTSAETTPAKIYSLYKQAVDGIRKAESESYEPTL